MFDANEISGLVQRLNLMLGGDAQKKIAFIAARPQEGTSTVARLFAEGMAEETHRKVLLIDAGFLDRERMMVDGVNPTTGISGAYNESGKAGDAIYKLDLNLYIGRWQGESDARNAAARVLHDTDFWETLQKEYPYIIIDAPALQVSSEGIALAAVSDATVLVEAETTRQTVIQNLRVILEAAGAKVIGSVMNKRRQYIPEKIYVRM